MHKEEMERLEREYYMWLEKRPKDAVPVGACIPWPRSKGVIGIRSKADPAPPPDPDQ